MPTLYLIPTPLADGPPQAVLPARVFDVVAQTDVFFVENVRSARRFITSLRIGRSIDATTFFDLHKDTPEAETRAQLAQLTAEQRSAGVLSEVGCPGMADPGAVAARLAHNVGWTVEPLIGPSSVLLALMASGLNGQSFTFHGYLPIEKAARAVAIRQLEKDARQRRQTQIFMETPYRNNQLLADVLAHAQPDTLLCIAANLTAPDALLRTQTIRQWRTNPPDLHKKPAVFLLL